MVKSNYQIKIEAGGEKVYNEISSFLNGISFETYRNGDNLFYYLDKKKEGIAKVNSKKSTIELTDKVEGWIINSINRIKKQEGVR
jgi:hypothetical protein